MNSDSSETFVSVKDAISTRKLRKKRNQEELLQKLEKKLRKSDKIKKPLSAGRLFTQSIALPGSILDNAQTPELRAYLAGQIARAAAIFQIDEVIIFQDTSEKLEESSTEGSFTGIGKHGQGSLQLARLLQYLECPQYLRKHFFPIHKDLQYAGLLNPTDMPHHLRASESSIYREGIVVSQKTDQGVSVIDVGLKKEIKIKKIIQVGVRVTVCLEDSPQIVSPNTPRLERGLYWGYNVRLADSLSSVFTQSSYKGGYDRLLGTSDSGSSVDDLNLKKPFQHLLIVFGGLRGLEAALQVDTKLKVENIRDLFDDYINTCPIQGSRTIRTEEAILVTLSALRPKIWS